MNTRYFTRHVLGITTFALVAPAGATLAEQPANAVQAFDYHHDNILGTAMDLKVVALSCADADAAESAVMAEIGRLQKILSAYQSDSELASLSASPVGGPGLRVSPELIDVLKQYESWSKRTDGAYTGHTGELLAIWKQAEKSSVLPTDSDLLAAAEHSRPPAWETNRAASTVRRVSDQQINIDSLGKGYIIDKAVAAATRLPDRLTGLLLNIGGDLRTWGAPSGTPGALWPVGIQDPAHPELNAPPLTTIFIPGNQSVSSSGAYQRFYTINGKRYSHIIDARTGKSGRNPAATVVAPDSATANALATICCTMKFTEGLELVRSVPNAEAIIFTTDGMKIRTDGFKELQDKSLAAERFAPQISSQFPAGFKLSIDLETTLNERRPYVFAWVTDNAGKYIETLAAYGDDPQWMREMHQWWKFAANSRALQSVTHATQPAGKYPLVWDGTNQKGSGVPLGKYFVWVEVGSEHGPYSAKFAPIELGKEPTTATIRESSAFSEVTLTYGPKAS